MNKMAGFGKHDMTCFIPGIGMMGYGQPHNTVKEVATKLQARAMIIEDDQKKKFILVHLEQAFVTLAIKEEILNRLTQKFPEWKIDNARLMVTAQHTHSAPGGYSHYPFYNFTVPGFQLQVVHTVCEGALEAISMAYKDLSPVTISYGSHSIAADKEVAFNRSFDSYLNNVDAPQLKKEDHHLAVNRKMEGLIFTDDSGKKKGFINWFGVHATSISSFNNRIHHDNKGVAAALYEKNHPGVTAFFMQEAAGDVSPNFIWNKKLKRMCGKFADQYENAAFNGEIQFREAEKIKFQDEIKGDLKCFHQFMDMSLEVAPAAHGVGFFKGTLEGPGLPSPLATILSVIAKGVRKTQLIRDPKRHQVFYDHHDPKDIVLDHRDGTFVGIPLRAWKKFPPIMDPTVEAFRKCAKDESVNTLPWVPHILPFQLVLLGPLAIVAVPGEITTIAAKRLKQEITMKLAPLHIQKVIISSYANAYMGYITTPEEYITQSYEAAHNIYGKNTLKGIIKGFSDLLNESPNNLQAFKFPQDELARRTVS